MSRRELCQYINENTPGDGSFWNLDSTSKIRFGCEMLKLQEENKNEQLE